MNRIKNAYSKRASYYLKILSPIVILFLGFSSSYSQSTTSKTFEIDSISVLRNPCTGWALYCEGWEFEKTWREPYPQVNPVNFWKQMDSVSAHKYATHIYIRILWSALEPEEGKYAWIYNPEFIQFIEEAKKRDLKLTFRIYASTKSRAEEGTPAYVFDAGATYSWESSMKHGKEFMLRDAYVDNPIWLAKFEKFLEAFALKFDNPDITDYIDGYGVGWWGEGHHINLMDNDNLPMLIDRMSGMYYKNFKNIITVYNLAHNHPDPTVVSDFDLARELVFEQRGFIPRRDGLGSHWFSNGDRDKMQNYFYPKNIPLIGEGCYWLHNPVSDAANGFLNDTRFKMTNWPEALKKGLDDALNFHSNTFDLRVPLEAKLWIEQMPDQVQRFITEGGYRLVPEKITYTDSAVVAGKISVSHTWQNTGVGMLPNDHPNWNEKYKVAFALLDPKDKKVISQTIIENSNPGTWIKGRYYTYNNQIEAGTLEGSYLLAVSIMDTKKNEAALVLSTKEESFNKWYPVGMVSVGVVKSKKTEELSTTENANNSQLLNSDGAIVTYNPNNVEELRIRGGLPNVFDKIKRNDTIRIAFVGGSITAANGWRVYSMNWFRTQYPNAHFEEINAAIPGTGSDFAAIRIEPDVMVKKPDLVLLEHRVNGGGGFEVQSVEGVIRQIWSKNPTTDICLVHTISYGMLPKIQTGRNTEFGAVMETLANKYDIPSIDFGVEVAHREMAAELAFKSDLPVSGQLWFSMDGVHPGEAGHDLYAQIFARSFVKMQSINKPKAHLLPSPNIKTDWEKTMLIPIDQAKLSSGWKAVNTQTDTIYCEYFKRTKGMLRGAVKCSKVGETVTIKWTGTILAFSDIPYGKGVKIQVTIDKGAPIILERLQKDKKKYARFFYLPEQKSGYHTAVLKVLELPKGTEYYLGQMLVAGSLLK